MVCFLRYLITVLHILGSEVAKAFLFANPLTNLTKSLWQIPNTLFI